MLYAEWVLCHFRIACRFPGEQNLGAGVDQQRAPDAAEAEQMGVRKRFFVDQYAEHQRNAGGQILNKAHSRQRDQFGGLSKPEQGQGRDNAGEDQQQRYGSGDRAERADAAIAAQSKIEQAERGNQQGFQPQGGQRPHRNQFFRQPVQSET